MNDNEQADILPRRIRWLAIATGVAASLALFPALLLFNPVLLTGGGIIQRRFPNAGKWLMWAGAAQLSVLLITYDVLFFPHPLPNPSYMRLTFSVATILVIWCDVEFVVDGLKRILAQRSMPPAEPRAVGRVEWIFAVIFSLLASWETAWAPYAYRHSGSLSALAMPLVQAAIVVAFDISLMRRVAGIKRARRGEEPSLP